jgi:hypothetical protein
MAVDFTDFTTGGTFSPDNYLVGYDVDASGGEKKWKYSTLLKSVSADIPAVKNVADSSTVNLHFTSSTGTLSADVIDGSITNSKLAFDGGSFAFRNKIINGAMDVWQRGFTFTGVTGGTVYSSDRWAYSEEGSSVVTLSRESNVPTNSNFNYSLRSTVTTADTAITANDFNQIFQSIEGFNIIDLIGNTFTLSFWVRGAKTGTHCISFVNGESAINGSYVVEYNINSANTWEYKTITVVGGINTSVGGPWDTTIGRGLIVRFALAAGSTYQTATTNSWIAGNFTATANQVNEVDAIGNIFAITGVQLERGAVATPFENRPIGTELSLCERYFEAGNLTTAGARYASTSGQWNMRDVELKQRMRAVPTITLKSISFVNCSNAQTFPSFNNFSIQVTVAANTNYSMSAIYEASAEL